MDLVKQFNIVLVSLDPTQGSEIRKTRPCVIISPNEMNEYLKTVIVAPMTSTIRNYPTNVVINFKGQDGNIMLSQIRTIDKTRIIKKIGLLTKSTSTKIKEILIEMFS